MASLKVNDCAPLLDGALDEPPSCIRRVRVRTPQSGAVRTMFLVASPPPCAMPSPVPMSCSRKSPNGWNVLLDRAGPTVNVPPLKVVLGSLVVVIERVWQTEQLSESKSDEPASVESVGTRLRSRGGALVERMKRVKVLMSSLPSSPQFTVLSLSHGWLSGTVSKPATERPSEEFSTRLKRLVMPISLRYASEENESRLAS